MNFGDGGAGSFLKVRYLRLVGMREQIIKVVFS